MCQLNFEEDELELYNEYLMFVRRKMNDDLELKLNENDLMEIEIDDIRHNNKKSIWKFLCVLIDKTKKFPESQNTTYIYEAIGFNDWLKMLSRDRKLKELGI